MRRLAYRPKLFVVYRPGAKGELAGVHANAGELVGSFTRYPNAEKAALKAGGAQVWAVHRSGAKNRTRLTARQASGGGTFTFGVHELVAYPKPSA